MKRLTIILLCVFMATLPIIPAFAANTSFEDEFFPNGSISTPTRAPYFYVFDKYEDGRPDNTHITMFYFLPDDVLKLCDELSHGEDLVFEKNKIAGFDIYMQTDVRFNDGEWFSSYGNWDRQEYDIGDYAGYDFQLILEERIATDTVDQMRSFEQANLAYHDEENHLSPYLKEVKTDDGSLWQYDLTNGSMTYRYRILIAYSVENDENGTYFLTSGWSPETVIGKNSTQKDPQLTKTEAPVLSDFSLDVNSEGLTTAHYFMAVPDSVYDNVLYYALRDEAFEMYGIEAQIRVNDGDWTEVEVANPRSLVTGFRYAFHEDLTSVEDQVAIRARLVSDKEEVGDSPWSNVLGNVAEEGEQITTVQTEPGEYDVQPVNPETLDNPEKTVCKLCGICPVQPLGICLFIWVGIIIVVILAIVILLAVAAGKKKRNTARHGR